jgi:hypothetical protein
VRTPDGTGSGWASAGARDWAKVDVAALGRIAAQKAVASRNPQTLEPGLHTVVLEPQAVNDLIPLLSGSFSARNADEGRSPFSKKGGGVRVGEKVVDEASRSSGSADPDLLSEPFDAEGLPSGAASGSRRAFSRTSLLAVLGAEAGQGRPAAGLRAGCGDRRHQGTDDLIAGCSRGVLVTHFFPHPLPRSAHGALYGLTRRNVPDRRRKNHAR